MNEIASRARPRYIVAVSASTAAVLAIIVAASVVRRQPADSPSPRVTQQRVDAAAAGSTSRDVTSWLVSRETAPGDATVPGQAAPPVAPTVDSNNGAVITDAALLLPRLPGYATTHAELLRWGHDATEHIDFEKRGAPSLTLYVDRLTAPVTVDPTSAHEIVSLLSGEDGVEVAVVQSGTRARVVELASRDGLHVKLAVEIDEGQQLPSDADLEGLARALLGHNAIA